MLPALAEYLDADKIRVQAPVNVIFICGGATSSVTAEAPISIRDAFLRAPNNPSLRGRDYILAEDVNLFYLGNSNYSDLLEFEVDLAQLTELIIIFPESSGSFVELGAFSITKEISERLLVVIRDKYYGAESFLRLGPILYLTNMYSESHIYVIYDNELNIIDNNVRKINNELLATKLAKPISDRINSNRDPTKFDRNRSGHVIKLIVGLIQEYGALTIEEIEIMLLYAESEKSRIQIERYLLCAEAVKWIKKEKRGKNTYFFALNVNDAAQLKFDYNFIERDRIRRRIAIREHWRKLDPDRYNGIVKFMGGIS